MSPPYSVHIGVSTGSLPRARAPELVAHTRKSHLTCVDVRVGKGHRWEGDGIGLGLDTVAESGLHTAFVGLGAHLGDGTPKDDVPREIGERNLPVKVFCVEDPDGPEVEADLARLRSTAPEVWVETHAGGPPIPRLLDLCEELGLGLVVDTLGLFRSPGGRRAPDRRLASFTRAIQVKGFDGTTHRHRPLDEHDLEPLYELYAAGCTAPWVTVESRAGALEDDARTLKRFLRSTVGARIAQSTEVPVQGQREGDTV